MILLSENSYNINLQEANGFGFHQVQIQNQLFHSACTRSIFGFLVLDFLQTNQIGSTN